MHTEHGREIISVEVPVWLRPERFTPPELEAKQNRSRIALLTGKYCANDSIKLKSLIFDHLIELVSWLSADEVEFAFFMGLAHFHTPENHRKQRTDRINQILDEEFADLPNKSPALQSDLDRLRKQAILVPDALLQIELRNVCFAIRMLLFLSDGRPAAYQPLSSMCEALENRFNQADLDDHQECLYVMLTGAMSRMPGQREVFMRQLGAMFDNKQEQLVVETYQKGVGLKLPRVLIGDAIERVVTQVLARPDAGTISTINSELKFVGMLNASVHQRLLLESIAAVRAGVPMGPSVEQTNRESIEWLVRMQAQSAQRPAPPSLVASADPDPKHAWSVERLVRWIDCPLGSSNAKPIDRKAIATRETQVRRQRQPSQKAPSTPPETVTDAQVGQVIEEALATTARFFLDESHDWLPRAEQLGVGKAHLQAVAALQPQLSTLANRPDTAREAQARALLQQAETALSELRQGIKAAQVSERLQSRFASAFTTALNAEDLVLGKRQGGVIACPLAPADLGWVAQQYHGRHLSFARQLIIDGQSVPLGEDMAVALYVTSGSLSGYAFDVSVHLWRRRAASASQPSQGSELYPVMNPKDWFDTFIPCCVLHVPLKG
ncbi:MAG: hypothetical protein ACK4NM_15200 [Hydrogenophaga sp.]